MELYLAAMDDTKAKEAAASLGRRGGLARAQKLTAEQRKQIAAKAAAKRWEGREKPFTATHVGVLPLNEIPCAVLENGTRVLSQRGFYGAIGAGTPGRRVAIDDSDFKLPAFLAAKNLRPFIDADLTATLMRPIRYTGVGHRGGGGTALGIEATLIPKICDVWLRARDAGALHHTQLLIAAKADLLVRALANTGIVALVDEATGYQYDRARNALAVILEEFISKELAAWVKTFDDDFYRELARLRGLAPEALLRKRPRYIGPITVDIVYKRLAPGVLAELRARNPKTENGGRRHRHHQWLTREVGHPKLREHLAAITAVMKLSPDFSTFKNNLDRVAPKFGDTYELLEKPHPLPAGDDGEGAPEAT